MESNQNNFAAWIASGERSSYFSPQAHSAMTYESRRFCLVVCDDIRVRSFRFLPTKHPPSSSSQETTARQARITPKQIKAGRLERFAWFAGNRDLREPAPECERAGHRA